jgi:predicted amidohydrolase YtcJ
MPMRWAAAAGAVTAVHGDHPASPVDPLRTLRTAVERRSTSGAVVGEEQALSVERALQAMTLDAAAQLGLAEEVGSLEVGKLADFTLLNRVPARGDLEGLRVEGTWREGQPVDTRAIRWLSPGLIVSTLMAYIGG